MVLVRLFLALLIAVALPIQGFAGATCMCKLRQAQEQAMAMAGSHGPSHPAATSAEPSARATTSWAAPATPSHHGSCAACMKACCQAAATAPAAAISQAPAVFSESGSQLDSVFASWAEPVPDKPPRS